MGHAGIHVARKVSIFCFCVILCGILCCPILFVILTLWLPNKIFCNCHVAPNTFFRFSSLAPNKTFGFSLLAPNKIWPSTFSRPPTLWFYFLKEILVLCKRAVYLFLWRIEFCTIWWKQNLNSTNSIPYKNSRRKNLAIKNSLLAKCIIQIVMPNCNNFVIYLYTNVF